ncbi:MAG: beta propeller repeat protein [Thermoplasmatota archaeon]
MRSLLIVGLVAFLVALPASAAPAAPAPAATFGPIVIVNTSDVGGEPGIDVDANGFLFMNAPSGNTHGFVYTSADDGASWSKAPGPTLSIGSFDSDGAIDACGTYYEADLGALSVSLAKTSDHGATWTSAPITLVPSPLGDRHWLDTGADCKTIYLVWQNGITGEWVGKSTDGGQTFPTQHNLAVDDNIGNIVVDKNDGTFYAIYSAGTTLSVKSSRDGLATTATTTVEAAPAGVTFGDSFPVVTVDSAHNVYAVWEQNTPSPGDRFDIYYAYSTDHAAHFSAPVLLASGAVGSNVFPWAAAGAAGQLDVVWYRAESGPANPNSNAGPWYVDFAASSTATSGTGFSVQHATSVPMHNDVICTQGTGCSGSTRDLLDFFQVALTPSGKARIAFADDTTDPVHGTGNGDPRNAFVGQSS